MSATNAASAVFFGGVPTGPDIQLIRERWPDDKLVAGTVIPYDLVAQTIGVDKASSRFRTVTGQWRRLVERESNIIIGARAGEGFIVLDEHAKVDLSGAKLTSSVRAVKRAHVVAARTNRSELDDNDKKRIATIQDRTAKILGAAQVRFLQTPMPSLLEGNGKT